MQTGGMSDALFTIGGHVFALSEALLLAVTVALGVLALVLWRQGRTREDVAMEQALRAQEADQRLRDLARIQHETAGRV